MGDPTSGPRSGRVAVVVDTSIGIAPDSAEALGIRLVPFQLIVDGVPRRDAIDVVPDEFFADLDTVAELPRTSAPAPGTWLDVFVDCWQDGLDVLALTCASSMTASHKAAVIAAGEADRPTRVIDSRTASAGEYLVATAGARAVRAGCDLEHAASVVEAVVRRVRVLGTLNRFDFLKRSGRVSAVAAFAAGKLHVNPVFQMVDGEARSFARTRSRGDALERIAREVRDEAAGHEGEKLHLAAMHAACPGDAAALTELVADLDAVESATTNFTPVMGVHTGPGVVGLGWWWEPAEGIDGLAAVPSAGEAVGGAG